MYPARRSGVAVASFTNRYNLLDYSISTQYSVLTTHHYSRPVLISFSSKLIVELEFERVANGAKFLPLGRGHRSVRGISCVDGLIHEYKYALVPRLWRWHLRVRVRTITSSSIYSRTYLCVLVLTSMYSYIAQYM